MKWREKTVYRILCLIAAAITENEDLRKEIVALSNHINYGAREEQTNKN